MELHSPEEKEGTAPSREAALHRNISRENILLALLSISLLTLASAPQGIALLWRGAALGAGAALALFLVLRSFALHFLNDFQSASPPRNIPLFSGLLLASANRTHHLLSEIEAIGVESQDIIERYRLLTDNIAASVVIAPTDSAPPFLSPYTEVLTGYAIRDLKMMSRSDLLERVNSEDRDRLQKAFAIALAGEPFQVRFRFQHSSGLEMWAETRVVPIFDDTGEVSALLAVSLDVTGSVRYQRQVEEKNRDLQDFTYMVSHDLKAPIATIKGMTSLLKKESTSPQHREFLQHIDNSARRVEALVESVIRYSRITGSSLQIEQVHPGEIITEVIAEHLHKVTDGDTDYSIHEGFPTLDVDRSRLYQIFSNLVGNAWKYRDKNRHLHIEIGWSPSSRTGYAELYVRDTGRGIPEEFHDSIFRPFHRGPGSEDDTEGTGVGLACVSKLVEQMGGKIRLESTAGKGSTFFLVLPMTRDDAPTESFNAESDPFTDE